MGGGVSSATGLIVATGGQSEIPGTGLGAWGRVRGSGRLAFVSFAILRETVNIFRACHVSRVL
jgi:hypothetical protein